MNKIKIEGIDIYCRLLINIYCIYENDIICNEVKMNLIVMIYINDKVEEIMFVFKIL